LKSATCSNFYEGCSQRESIAWFSLLNPASKAVALGICKFLFAWRRSLRLCHRQFSRIFEFFRILAPGVAPGYSSGHKKICICLQAMPSAFYCTIFALRLCQNLHMQNFCAFRLRLGRCLRLIFKNLKFSNFPKSSA
ncbi:hypothetical protein T4C_13533, partial [Trichinella pseudospiralis]